MNVIVGIHGPAGSGKSSVAKAIQSDSEYIAKIMPFSSPIKDMALRYYGWDEKKDARGRLLLQKIGEIGRAYDTDCWVKCWTKEVNDYVTRLANRYIPNIIIADDVRYMNEVRAINGDANNILIKLTLRPDSPLRQPDTDYTHESERELPDIHFDLVLPADIPLFDLKDRVVTYVEHHVMERLCNGE